MRSHKSVESKENLLAASGQRGVCVGIERLAEEGSSGSEVEEDQWSNSLFLALIYLFMLTKK